MSSAILLSGGIDSTALAYWKKPAFGIHISYGQLAAMSELIASREIAKSIGMELIEINVDCSSLGSGDLTRQPNLNIAPVSEWWPYRNQLLITLASMKAVALGNKHLMIGSVRTDNRHLDGTQQFIKLINKLVIYQEGKLKIIAPAINLSSSELVVKSGVPKSILGWTHSCHTSDIPCGQCNGCSKHIETKSLLSKSNR